MGGDGHVAEARVSRRPSVVELKRPVSAEDVLKRLGNLFGVTAEPFLEISLAGKRFGRIGDQAAGGLGAGCEEL